MSVVLHRHRGRQLCILMLIFCLLLPSAAMATHLKDDLRASISNHPFSILILGDSQMAGAGWEGGYANCIKEVYPQAQVLNFAQNGNLLANGDIRAQWEFFVSEGFSMPDFVLLDGGINDLSYIRKEHYDDDRMMEIYESLQALIERIHEVSPDTHVIYTLIPPLVEWKDKEKGPPSYAIQERFWKYMTIVASAYDYVTVLDLFSLNPFCYPCTECYHAHFADSIHLNETGYRKSFEYLDNILLAHLAQKLDALKHADPQ